VEVELAATLTKVIARIMPIALDLPTPPGQAIMAAQVAHLASIHLAQATILVQVTVEAPSRLVVGTTAPHGILIPMVIGEALVIVIPVKVTLQTRSDQEADMLQVVILTIVHIQAETWIGAALFPAAHLDIKI